MKTEVSLLIFCAILSIQPIKAQVTIGSDTEPRKGTLLDLKSNYNKGDNATQGLGLPRVALSDYNTLTLDNQSQSNDYVGLTVYNITDNANIREGIYTWDGSRWRVAVTPDNYGRNNEFLSSDGDGTYSWGLSPIPEYKFHNPTWISTFENGTVTIQDLPFSALIRNYYGNDIYGPDASAFNNKEVYTVSFTAKTAAGAPKYILMGLTAHIWEKAIQGKPIQSSIWQTVQIDIIIDGTIKKTYQRMASTPLNGSSDVNIDIFTMLHVPDLSNGAHTLKVKISNIRNTFRLNVGLYGKTPGTFDSSETQFYCFTLKDINFVLYEDD